MSGRRASFFALAAATIFTSIKSLSFSALVLFSFSCFFLLRNQTLPTHSLTQHDQHTHTHTHTHKQHTHTQTTHTCKKAPLASSRALACGRHSERERPHPLSPPSRLRNTTTTRARSMKCTVDHASCFWGESEIDNLRWCLCMSSYSHTHTHTCAYICLFIFFS